jgi:hypothetical protein
MAGLNHVALAAFVTWALFQEVTMSPPPAVIEHEKLVSPTSFGSGPSPQGAAMRGVFYFLPPPGGKAFITYNIAKKTWGTLDIDASSGVTAMLKGASLAAVPATAQALDDFLVVSGGGTKNVVAFNMRTKSWKAMPTMQNAQMNACSVGCLGFWMSMTGDLTTAGRRRRKHETGGLEALKPENRQEYRYNLTSGEHFEVNGEKERGGAGCACDESANAGAGRAFWAGGYSNSGLTTQIEMWSVNPNKRGGQPIFKMSAARRDVGASACGGRLIVAGGKDGKVDVYNSSSSTDGELVSFNLGAPIASPRIGCVGKRVALISGGKQNKIFVVDTSALPAAGATVTSLPAPLSGAGLVAVAADPASGSVMFFDGQHGDLMSVKGSPVVV